MPRFFPLPLFSTWTHIWIHQGVGSASFLLWYLEGHNQLESFHQNVFNPIADISCILGDYPCNKVYKYFSRFIRNTKKSYDTTDFIVLLMWWLITLIHASEHKNVCVCLCVRRKGKRNKETKKVMHSQVPGCTHLRVPQNVVAKSWDSKGAPNFQHYKGVEGRARSPGIRLGRGINRSSLNLHPKQTTKWLVHIPGHPWVLG
jgi:hypothetical protein